MCWFRIFILFFLFTMVANPVAANEITYTLFNESNGLNRSHINDIERGTLGYYWMATEQGLIRFDGKNFLEINPKEKGFRDQEVRKLYRYKNTLYIIYQDSGCFSMDLLTYRFRPETQGVVSDVVHLNDSEVVFLMEDGTLTKYSGKMRTAEVKYGVTTPGLLTIFNNKLIVSLPGDGVYVVDQKTLAKIRKLKIPENGILEFSSVVGESFFYLWDGNMYEMDNNLTSTRMDHLNMTYFSFLSPSNQFYIQSRKHLVEINKGIAQEIPLQGLVNFELRNLIVQDVNNILIGTNQGLILVRKIERTVDNIDDNTIDEDIDELRIRRKVLENDDHQLILFGSPYSYLYNKDRQFKKILNERMSVYDAVKVGHYIYAATEGAGLQRIDMKKGNSVCISVAPLSSEGMYTSIYYDSVKSNLLIGSHNHLIIFNLIKNKADSFRLPTSDAMIRSLIKDHVNQVIWMGTSEGLFYLDGNLKTIHPVEDETISKESTNDLQIRSNTNELWIAHDDGVDILDLKTRMIQKKIPRNIFVNPNTVSLVEDGNGLIWMGTYSGIVAYNPLNEKFLRLSRNNGLINAEFKHKAALKMTSGKLIFGGLSGYDIIDPTLYEFNNVEDRGLITGYHRYTATDSTFVMVKDTTLEISFDTEKEFLHLYLSSTNFINSANHTYEYNIDGREWIRISGPYYINILRLNPGRYQINIRAFDESGALLGFYPVMITATVPFYKSRIFLVALVAITFLFFLLFIITVFNARNQEERLKEQISMDLHDEVGTILTRALHMIRHDVSNTGKSQLSNYISESLFSLRVFINTMNKRQFSLRELEDEINEMIHNHSEEQCVIKVNTSGQVDYKMRGELFRDIKLCLYEIINNTLKHSRGTLLIISLHLRDHTLAIHTRDNGLLTNISEIENKGNGIRNIRKRVDRNRGNVIFSIYEGGGLEINIQYPL